MESPPQKSLAFCPKRKAWMRHHFCTTKSSLQAWSLPPLSSLCVHSVDVASVTLQMRLRDSDSEVILPFVLEGSVKPAARNLVISISIMRSKRSVRKIATAHCRYHFRVELWCQSVSLFIPEPSLCPSLVMGRLIDWEKRFAVNLPRSNTFRTKATRCCYFLVRTEEFLSGCFNAK